MMIDSGARETTSRPHICVRVLWHARAVEWVDDRQLRLRLPTSGSAPPPEFAAMVGRQLLDHWTANTLGGYNVDAVTAHHGPSEAGRELTILVSFTASPIPRPQLDGTEMAQALTRNVATSQQQYQHVPEALERGAMFGLVRSATGARATVCES